MPDRVQDVTREPACSFGWLIDERLQDLQEDVTDLKATSRWLLYLVAGTIIAAMLKITLDAFA